MNQNEQNTMVKALTEIVSVDIGQNLVSMTIVEKQNESGLKYNQRLFIVVHGVYFGYISKVKLSDDPNKINIAQAKVKVPVKNLYSSQVDKEILTIKFTINDEGKLVPKEWVLKTASEKLANLWRQLLDYEIKMRSKSPPPKKGGSNSARQGSSTSRKSIQKPQINKQKTQNPKPVVNSKPEGNPPPKPITKVFENPLFEDDNDSEQQQRRKVQKLKKSKSPTKTQKKQSQVKNDLNKNQTSNKPIDEKSNIDEKPKVVQKPTEPIKKQEIKQPALKKLPDPPKRQQSISQPQQKPIQPQKKQQQKQVSPQEKQNVGKILKQKQKEQVKIQQTKPQKPSGQVKKKQPQFQLQLEKIEQQQVEQSPVYNDKKKIIQKPSPPKKQQGYFKKEVKKVSYQQIKQDKKIDLVKSESDYINNIIKQLAIKNQKYPFQQITYKHQDIQKLMKIYEKDLKNASNDKNRAQLLLKFLMENQRQKMNRSSIKSNNNQNSWIYKLITKDQTQNIINFRSKCNLLMKQLYVQLHNGDHSIFKKIQQDKNKILFQIEDIEVKVALITYKGTQRQQILDDSMQKQVKRQFKYLNYLYRIIKNQGKIRIPYTCLCQYGGIVALFKAKGKVGQKEKVMDEIEIDLKQLQNKSKLPLNKILKTKLKGLKQLYYNDLRKGQTQLAFKYCIPQQIDEMFACDFNALNPSHSQQLRMELIEDLNIQSILPACTNSDLEYSNSDNKFEKYQQLAKQLKKRVNSASMTINQSQFYFIDPRQLSNFLHSKGINIRYLKDLYQKANDPFIKSSLLSEMVARCAKILIRKAIQDQCLQNHVKNSKSTYQQLELSLKDKYIDILNCIFGVGSETDAIWSMLYKILMQKFQVQLNKTDDINKGQLLISLVYHCNLSLNWNQIQSNTIFTKNQYLNKLMIKQVLLKMKSFEPSNLKDINIIKQKLKIISNENFTFIINQLKLKQQKIPNQFYIYSSLVDQIKLYLCNFIQPQQLDWANNYSHLAIYDIPFPTVYFFQTQLLQIKWYLKNNKKQKYLQLFNEFTKKINNIYGGSHPLLSEMYQIFSQHHKSKGDIEDSINFMKSSILNYSALFGDNNQSVAIAYYKLGQLCLQFNRCHESQDYLEKANKIMSHLQIEKSLTQAKIRLLLASLYFKNQKYKQSLSLINNKTQIFESDNKQFQNQRAQMFQLTYYSQSKCSLKAENIRLCNELQKKLQTFKNHNNYAEILLIIIQNYMNNLPLETKQTMKKLIQMIPTKNSINFYKKSFMLLQKRYEQKNLFESFKKYTENAVKIVDLIIQKNLLKVWQNLSKIHERQTLFDFIGLIEELIYFLGRDRLNAI